MKKLLMPLFASLLLLAACDKDQSNIQTNCDTGTIRFTNKSTDPYNIYLDGNAKGVLQYNSYIEFDVNKGEHVCKAVQASGFIVDPTERTTTFSIFGCDELEFIFP